MRTSHALILTAALGLPIGGLAGCGQPDSPQSGGENGQAPAPAGGEQEAQENGGGDGGNGGS
jgi:hypothetical protein